LSTKPEFDEFTKVERDEVFRQRPKKTRMKVADDAVGSLLVTFVGILEKGKAMFLPSVI